MKSRSVWAYDTTPDPYRIPTRSRSGVRIVDVREVADVPVWSDYTPSNPLPYRSSVEAPGRVRVMRSALPAPR